MLVSEYIPPENGIPPAPPKIPDGHICCCGAIDGYATKKIKSINYYGNI